MVKIAFVADVHCGNHKRFGDQISIGVNRRGELVLGTLHRALGVAVNEHCEVFVVLGDLFDSDHPEPQLIARVQHLFRQASQASGGMRIVCLLGNHESVTSGLGDNALGPLSDVADIADVPIHHSASGVDVWLVPFTPGVPALGYISAALDGLEGSRLKRTTRTVLALHCGIRDEHTPPWLKTATNSIDVKSLVALCVQHKISQVVAGDWHSRREWLGNSHPSVVSVLQVGTLCPTGFSDAGFQGFGNLAIWEDNGKPPKQIEIPGPRFIKTSEAELAPILDKRITMARAIGKGGGEHNQLFVSWTRPATDLLRAQERLDYAKRLGHIVDGEVLADEQESEIAARTAAQRASSAATLDEALDGFCQAMQLEPGVDRAEVHRRSREYLGASSPE